MAPCASRRSVMSRVTFAKPRSASAGTPPRRRGRRGSPRLPRSACRPCARASPRPRTGRPLGQLAPAATGGAVGVEGGEVLADDFFRRVLLDPLRALVPTGDPAGRVEHEDRVIGHCTSRRNAARSPSGPLRLAALGQVAGDLGEAEQDAFVVEHGVITVSPRSWSRCRTRQPSASKRPWRRAVSRAASGLPRRRSSSREEDGKRAGRSPPRPRALSPRAPGFQLASRRLGR